MPDTLTILIAVSDGVLADSLRFSLELEGYAAKLCDEGSVLPAMRAGEAAACLVLDQNVFVGMMNGDGAGLFTQMGVPAVLLAEQKTPSVLARAKRAGVTKVVEKPLLGGVLLEAIRHAIDEDGRAAPPLAPC